MNTKKSQEILMDEIYKNGGMNVKEIIELEEKRHLWFGGVGIIRVLLNKMSLGIIEYDEETEKFVRFSDKNKG